MFKGIIDLSHHNPVSAFWDIKGAGIAAVIHKATQGTKGKDNTYADRATRIQSTGMLLGAYHFGTNAPGASQAKQFLSVVKPGAGTLLVLDWEGNNGDDMTLAQAEDFANEILTATGKLPVLYSGQAFLTAKMRGVASSPLYGCSLWMARYSILRPKVPKGYSNWAMWQYTSSGRVKGVSGNVDCNKFNGGEAEFRSWWSRRAVGEA